MTAQNNARPGDDSGARLKSEHGAGDGTESKTTSCFAAVDRSGVAIFEDELSELLGWAKPAAHRSTQAALTDAERLAMAFVDTYGPTWARRLASEIEQVADEIAPRRPFGGDRR